MTIMKRNKGKKRVLSVALALTMTATMTAMVPTKVATVKAADTTVSNPRVEYNTRDTIEFGHYLQEDTNGDGKVDEKDEKQPIKWQILSKNGNDLFLLADKALDCKVYNETSTGVTWETCTLRTWLNDDFLNTAFSEAEQKGITTTNVVNADNPEYTTNGGNNTQDKIFLLSLDEVANTSYGFRSDRGYYDQARICEATSYAKKQGAFTNDEDSSWWWLRSPGTYSYDAAFVHELGYAYALGSFVHGYYGAVRPALHLNLSSLTSSDYKMCEQKNVSVKASTYDLVELGGYERKALQWRVLSKNGNDVFLLADRCVTEKRYNDEYKDITWEDCDLRAWLNADFYNTTFSDSEKAAIQKTTYKNADNPIYNTFGGNDTKDYVTLLSLSDIVNPSYGFPEKYCCNSETRIATSLTSDDTSQYSSWWWLRSPGDNSDSAAGVDYYGYALANGDYVDDGYDAVRPALHLNLTSLSSLKVVGTVVAGEDGNQYYDTNGKKTDGTVPDAPTTETHTIHVKDEGTRVEPTCEKKGSITYKCTKCGEVMEVVELDATGHIWDAGKVTKEATETAEGVKTYTCSVCGKTKTEVIPKKTATTQEPPKKGDVVKDDKTSVKVEVTDVKKKEVEYKEPANKKAKTVSIPATVKINGVTYNVTKIADNAFKNNKTVTKVTVGSNIKTIGKNAFSGATKLKNVSVGKNVTEVGANAFKGCSSLTSVTLGSKATKIGANAFSGCKKLKTIKITSTKLTSKTVSKNAFKGLTKATTIKVPKKKLSAYKKLFKQKGLSSKVKVKGY